jgi:hypothetical protein
MSETPAANGTCTLARAGLGWITFIEGSVNVEIEPVEIVEDLPGLTGRSVG